MLIARSAEFPIYECLINEGWGDEGLATIVVVRKLPNMRYLFATYMVDVFCLGLKNTFCNADVLYSMVNDLKSRYQGRLIEIDYEDARSIVLGAIDYASSMGFEPNKDWVDSKNVIDYERSFENKFEFGKDGEPFFIQGPDDNAEKILSKLRKAMPNQEPKFIVGGPL